MLFGLGWNMSSYDNPNVKARTLFATHYHELTDLSATKSGVKNYNVLVTENDGVVAFTHKIGPGCADKSYGIHVAQLAGLPMEVIRRAREVLGNLEHDEFSEEGKPRLATPKTRRNKENPDQLTLF